MGVKVVKKKHSFLIHCKLLVLYGIAVAFVIMRKQVYTLFCRNKKKHTIHLY